MQAPLSFSIKFCLWFIGTCMNNVEHPTQGKHQLTRDQLLHSSTDYKVKLYLRMEELCNNDEITQELIDRYS